MRGAWIGIYGIYSLATYAGVAPHAGSVDWNYDYGQAQIYGSVAPHAGSVDWNIKVTFRDSARTRVAPHAGSVDWNNLMLII